jgi:hypothetical protein
MPRQTSWTFLSEAHVTRREGGEKVRLRMALALAL